MYDHVKMVRAEVFADLLLLQQIQFSGGGCQYLISSGKLLRQVSSDESRTAGDKYAHYAGDQPELCTSFDRKKRDDVMQIFPNFDSSQRVACQDRVDPIKHRLPIPSRQPHKHRAYVKQMRDEFRLHHIKSGLLCR